MTPRTLTASESETLRQAHDLFLSIPKPHAAQLRTAIPAKEHPYAPIDGYAPGLKKMREDLPPAPRMKDSPCPMSDPNYKPGDGSSPDPYKIALEQLRKEGR